MNLEETLTECVSGARMTAPHMQTGCYIEHSFTRGFLRCWPVDRIEDEPNRTQCEFRANDDDRAADWIEVERPKPVASKWGAPPPKAVAVIAHVHPSGVDIAALAAVGFIIPGATPAVDIDAPKRDSWGRPVG